MPSTTCFRSAGANCHNLTNRVHPRPLKTSRLRNSVSFPSRLASGTKYPVLVFPRGRSPSLASLRRSACRPISPLPATSHRLSDSHGFLRVATALRSASVLGWTCWPRRPSMGFALENQVRTGLTAGARGIRTAGPPVSRSATRARRMENTFKGGEAPRFCPCRSCRFAQAEQQVPKRSAE